MRYRRVVAVLMAAFALAMTALIGAAVDRSVATAAGYDRNLIMSNAVFDASGTMSAAQIQAVLDRYPNSCLKDYVAPVPQGYSSYGAPSRASEVIRAAATLWGINPQVLLVTLEKEQSIVTGGGGCDPWRYWSAMGYNCPDGGGRYDYPALGITGTCVKREVDAGFAAQVNHGAWQLQFNRQRAEGNLGWNNSSSIHNYGFNTAGYRQASANEPSIYYDGWATISGQPVFMTNGATASLYTYTPHLSANLAFYNLFVNWFGSTGTPTNPPPPPTTGPPATVPPTAPSTTRPPTTLPPQPSAATTTYVDNVHRVFMGRPATSGELRLWGSYLAGGGSRAYFVTHVAGSDGYAQNLIRQAYQSVLGRNVDRAGLDSWTQVVATHGRDDILYAGLAGSSEYFKVRASNDDQRFVAALYEDFLGRKPDSAGLNQWTAALAATSMTRGDVAFSILQSREYSARVIGKSYAQVLGRWPDAAGWDYWTTRYSSMHQVAQVHSALAMSPEGFAVLSSPR